jgi:hypothetical protein
VAEDHAEDERADGDAEDGVHMAESTGREGELTLSADRFYRSPITIPGQFRPYFRMVL